VSGGCIVGIGGCQGNSKFNGSNSVQDCWKIMEDI